MADIFKHVFFLAPLIGFMIAIPLIYLFDYCGFLTIFLFLHLVGLGLPLL